jgi:S1-C subfamily serine protease
MNRYQKSLRWMQACMLGVALSVAHVSHADSGALSQTIRMVKPAVVAIGTYEPTRAPRAQLRGTGYAVGDGLHVVTNYHVTRTLLDFDKKESLGVFVGTGENARFRPARVVASDAAHDVVLLKIDGTPLPTLKIADSSKVEEGWQLVFTGYPIGAVLGLYPSTIRAGIASITPVVRPAPNAGELDAKMLKRIAAPFEIYQLDATSYPGNSGSPLYDPQTGEVYGTVNSTFVKSTKESVLSDPSGISYAIPSRYVLALMQQAGLRQ